MFGRLPPHHRINVSGVNVLRYIQAWMALALEAKSTFEVLPLSGPAWFSHENVVRSLQNKDEVFSVSPLRGLSRGSGGASGPQCERRLRT